MHLFAGTYERFLFGYKVEADSEKDVQLVRYCTHAAHQHPVKCIGVGGHILASGGADDQIHLYDIKHGKDMGYLMNPGDGAVPCIQFYSPPGAGGAPSHMFTGSADGTIAVWIAGGQWEHLKLMRGHEASVNSLSVHLSGRLALSVAHDKTLRMWDLAKGKCSYVTKMDVEGEQIDFLPDGASYCVLSGNKVTLHAAAGEGELIGSITTPRRITTMAMMGGQSVLLGCEDGSIKVWDVREKDLVQSVERGHTSRIRGIAPMMSAGKTEYLHLGTASSDGIIKLWDARMFGSNKTHTPECLSEVASRARITCLAAVDPKAPKPKAPVKTAAAKEAAAGKAQQGPAGGKQAQQQKQKQVAGGKGVVQQGGKKQVGKQQQQQLSKKGKPVGGKPQQSPGFEIVSERQIEERQKRKREQQDMGSDDDHDDDGDGAAPSVDPRKLAKATVYVKTKVRKAGNKQQGGKPAKK